MPRYLRKRLKVALLGIFCLLSQQAALAAYVCPTDGARAGLSTTTGGCAEMKRVRLQDSPALCVKHCHPDQTATTDAAKLSVPPLAFASPGFSPLVLRTPSGIAVCVDVPITRSDPPPRLQYCSLLI